MEDEKLKGRADEKYFTVVFEGDIGKIPGNPFKVESIWGRPVVLSRGNLADECDNLEVEIETLLEKAAYPFQP